MRSERQRPASISAVVLAPAAAEVACRADARGVSREVALETGSTGRLADAVRDRASPQSAEHRALWSGSLRTDAPQRSYRVAADKELAPAPAWSPLLRRTVSRPPRSPRARRAGWRARGRRSRPR